MVPATMWIQPLVCDIPTIEFEASQLFVFHLESQEEVLKSLRLIPALRVEISSWSEAISKSVIELLDRKLFVSQMVVSEIVMFELEES